MFSLTPYRRSAIQVSPDVFGIERLFENFFQDSLFPVDLSKVSTMKVDIKDTEKAYVLEADLPGLNKEDLHLEFENDCLTIAVERDEQLKTEQDNYLHRERRFSSLARTFSFENVDQEQITAQYENGVLTVSLPKTETKAQGTRIQIS